MTAKTLTSPQVYINNAAREDLSLWSDESLLDYEEQLYDMEIDGEDVWFERDQVLWEINRRQDSNQ